MKGSSLNVEKIFYDSAENIEIDRQFKNDLKKRIMASAAIKDKQVIELNNRRSKMPYMKVAGWVLFAALSGSSIWGAGNLYSHMVAVNNPTQKVIDVPSKDALKSQSPNTQNSNSNPNPIGDEKNVASAVTQNNLDKNQAAAGVIKMQPSKAETNTSVNKGTTKPQSQSASGITAGTSVTAPLKPADTTANTVTNTPAVTEPVNTITLTMEAGRYIIKNISVTKSDIVPTLPEEFKSLTADECASLPAVSSGQLVYENEKDGTVHMISHVNNKDILVDKGKTPVLYAPIGLVSYIKDAASGDSAESKSSSEVWAFDSNSTNKYNLLSSEDGKYSYVNTFWSGDGKALYILEENNDTKKYDILKLTLDIQ
jgi:hypothetical protein